MLHEWTQNYVNVRFKVLESRAAGPLYIHELGLWGVKATVPFDGFVGRENILHPDDHTEYLFYAPGDVLCPFAEFWNDTFEIIGDGGWTKCFKLDDQSNISIGWAGTRHLNGFRTTHRSPLHYMAIDLGVSNIPLPPAYAQILGDIWPPVHCTLGYFPLLSKEVAANVQQHGNMLIRKYIRDGDLPRHSMKPHKLHDGGIAGMCSYRSRYIAKHGNNVFDLMYDGKVEVQANLQELTAVFDHIHLSTQSRFTAVGSLEENCDVYRLARLLQGYLCKEVFGQFDNPDFSPAHHHLSKPHVTLAKTDCARNIS